MRFLASRGDQSVAPRLLLLAHDILAFQILDMVAVEWTPAVEAAYALQRGMPGLACSPLGGHPSRSIAWKSENPGRWMEYVN